MIEHELLFLGLLQGGPKHGYEIKRHIQEELSAYIGLNIKSIYYPLKKMEEGGLIEKEVGRQGLWPEKYVYKITPRGQKKFDELIAESFLSLERPFFRIDLSLYFLAYIDKAMARRRLRARIGLLKKIRKQLALLNDQAQKSSKNLALILQHDLDMVDAEIQSFQRVINQLEI